MKLRDSLTVNFVALIGFLASCSISCMFYFGTLNSSLINNNVLTHLSRIQNLLTTLISVKAFIVFISLYVVELIIKKFLKLPTIPKLKILKEAISKKFYASIFYGGLCLYITSLFDRIPPGFLIADYFFIMFIILLTLIISNNKLAVHKYYTVNNLVWSMVLSQMILIIYVIAILLLQNVLGIDGLENLFVLLTAGIIYGYFILLFLTNLIAIPVEFILRKTKKISNYYIVNSSKLFKFIIYSLSIILSGFVAFCLYILIEAFKNID